MIKTLKKTVRLFINKEIKFVFVFNFHRIGNVDPKNPFHKLHTVGEKLFKTQMLFLSFFGKFVSLEEIRNNKNLSNPTIISRRKIYTHDIKSQRPLT